MRAGPVALVCLALGVAPAGAAPAHEGDEIAALPDGPDLYQPPPPGSYELPPIQTVSERSLLAPEGSRAPLLGLEPEQCAVVSFIYRSCSEAGGCPLALAVLRRLDRELAERPKLAARTRLVTVSFDPARDTPARMGELRRLLEPRGRWSFLTGADEAELRPVLADFGQDVLPLLTEEGVESSVLKHVLKVFLVDGRGRVRNIYSTGFLRADVILNDVLTVLGEEGGGH